MRRKKERGEKTMNKQTFFGAILWLLGIMLVIADAEPYYVFVISKALGFLLFYIGCSFIRAGEQG